MERYDGQDELGDVAVAVAVSPDGSTVFVTGDSATGNYTEEIATVAYDAASGARLTLGMSHVA